MAIANVQFEDSTEAVIISYFGCAQDSSVVQNLGTIDTSDARWKTYFDAQPSIVQEALPSPTDAASE